MKNEIIEKIEKAIETCQSINQFKTIMLMIENYEFLSKSKFPIDITKNIYYQAILEIE